MGLLSTSVSLTRYRVEGRLAEPILETIANGLSGHAIGEGEENITGKSVGWTSFSQPFDPNFDGYSFAIGPYLVFALRVDKKTIPTKVIKKNIALESAKLLSQSGRQYLSREEKQKLREKVEDVLSLRIPSVPHIYDLAWHYEKGILWFFSNGKSANEDLETLFFKSFNLSLIRLFPYTIADLGTDLSSAERDQLTTLSPTLFAE